MLLRFPLFGLPTGIQGFAFADNSEDTTTAGIQGFAFADNSEDTTDAVTTANEASAVPETTEAQDCMIIILWLLLLKENKHRRNRNEVSPCIIKK